MEDYSPKDDGKTAGIVSYFTIVGWLIAYFAMYQDNKTALASYQLRQTLLFHLVSMVAYYAIGAMLAGMLFTGGFSLWATLYWVVKVALFIMWIVGLIGAVNGDRKPIPFIGEKAQSVFSGI